MLQLIVCYVYLIITSLAILYGLYGLCFPLLRARISVWRLLYRIVMMVRRRPAKPVARWRIIWARSVGAISLAVGLVWLLQLHPDIRVLSRPLYVPGENQWQVEQGDGAAEERAVLERLERATQSGLGPNECVGMFIAVVHGDKNYTLRVGRKTLSRVEPPDADTEFEIGSITKVFTSIALAVLVEEQQVDLDDPVSRLLPEGWSVPVYEGREITIEDLATHHSGLPRMPDKTTPGELMDGLLLNTFDDPYRNATEEYVRGWLAGYALERAPGSVYEYSNVGGGLLGYALAVKTEQSYESLIEKTICGPLEMRDTAVTLDAGQEARAAQGYMGHIAIGRVCIALPMTRWTMTEAFQGCGSLCSTPNDMLKFLRACILAPEGPLGRALARTHDPLHDTDMDGCKVGLGIHAMSVEGLDDPMYWHNGGTGGFNSFMAYSKKDKTGVLMLASGYAPETLAAELLKALQEESHPQAAGTEQSHVE